MDRGWRNEGKLTMTEEKSRIEVGWAAKIISKAKQKKKE